MKIHYWQRSLRQSFKIRHQNDRKMTLLAPSTWVMPGDRLCTIDGTLYESGDGTYVIHGQINASLVGTVVHKERVRLID